jgi:hypothetical protein
LVWPDVGWLWPVSGLCVGWPDLGFAALPRLCLSFVGWTGLVWAGVSLVWAGLYLGLCWPALACV